MSKLCAASECCPYHKEQTTAGCPCADLCAGYTEPKDFRYGTTTAVPYLATDINVSHKQCSSSGFLERGIESPQKQFTTASYWVAMGIFRD